MPETVVVSPESYAHYPNDEEHQNVVVTGGPAVVIQGEKATFIPDDAKAHKLDSDDSFDVFAVHSARLTFYGADEKLPKERDNAPKKPSSKKTTTNKSSARKTNSGSRSAAGAPKTKK